MDAWRDVDLALFGGAGTEEPVLGQQAKRAADGVLLELKSADAAASAEEQRQLLAEMMREMRAQFIAFRDLRAKAEALCEVGDEAAQKLARADLKAAGDAMSLIVRTLEKVDGLQRQLLRDREMEEERQANESGYPEAVHEVERLIEARAQELFEQWKRDFSAGTGGCRAAGADPPEGGNGCSAGGERPPDA
ncbi:hypothetical protein ACFSE1_13865 [Rhizobium helianthi]|uniref:Uncharacterized protein n=1 Tax=Rhizobium helianthi TaxID=1132695 RepID=A0ABW4M5U1_9HYPH